MSTNSLSFRSISKISKWLVNWSIVLIIISVINSMVFSTVPVSSSELTYDNIGYVSLLVAFVNLVIVIVIGIVTLIWFYRANKNIHSFNAKDVSSPRMAVIWWFIPIANIWKPYQVAQQIWKASDPQIVLSNGTEWKKSPSSNTIKIWWLLGILSILVSVSLQFFFPTASAQFLFEHTYEEGESTIFNEQQLQIVVSSIIGIISSIFFIRMIKQVSRRQEIKGGRSI